MKSKLLRYFYESFTLDNSLRTDPLDNTVDNREIDLSIQNKQKKFLSTELSELLSIAREDMLTDPESVLHDCNLIFRRYGARAEIYEIIGYCYMRLNQYDKAEISFLKSIALGSKSKSHYMILEILSKLRGDEIISRAYSDEILAIQSNDLIE